MLRSQILRRAAALAGALALSASPALANTSPYDGTGYLIQGPSCVLYQDDASGTVFNNADPSGFGSFAVGDHVRIVAEQYPCFFPSCSGVACINSIALIEPFGAGVDPSTPDCFGDGTSLGCPCGNQSAVGAGEGCVNSTGVGALLSASGSAFVADDTFTLHAVQARPGQPCVFVQGATPIEVPFRDGILCMGTPTERLEVAFLDAQGAADSSVSLVTEGGAAPGATLHYQLWYRDPSVSPCGTGSNLTNSVSLTWQ